MKQSLRQTQEPRYPLGAYIKRWCIDRGISQKEFALGAGYTYQHQVFKLKSTSIETLFRIVDFMAQNSALPEEFYLSRLKSVIQGTYKWTI